MTFGYSIWKLGGTMPWDYQEVVLNVKGEPNTLLKVQPTRTNILGSANNLPGGMFAH